MRFNLQKASDDKFNATVEINSIEDLMKFVDKEGRIVIDRKFWEEEENDYTVLIYDDYIE